MDSFLELAGLALTSAASFSLALLLGWSVLAGLLRLLPASAPAARPMLPVREVGAPPAVRDRRRTLVVLTKTRNRSGKIYAVRTA